MNKDAKIGVVIILLMVGVVVVLWGRSEPTDQDMALMSPEAEEGIGLPPPARIPPLPARAGDPMHGGITALSPDEGMLALPDDALAIPDDTADTPGSSSGDDMTIVIVPQAPPPPPAPKTWTYTVANTDLGLEQIAEQQLGKARRWNEIAKLNNLSKPYIIKVGQKLVMPPKEGVSEIAAAAPETRTTPAAPPSGTRKYVVKVGDIGLIQIARDELGAGNKWRQIAELNNLAAPYRIDVGQVLLLPE